MLISDYALVSHEIQQAVTARNQAPWHSKMELALLQARDAERRSIARDLHDVTAQLLLRLEFNLHAIGTADSMITDLARKDAGEVITQLQRQVRCVAYLLHPPELEQLGLCGALDALAAGMSARTGIEIGFKCRGRQGESSTRIDMSLFRVAQEALMNVFKHSGAHKAEMRLSCSGNWMCLRIRDFGVGIAGGKGLRHNSGVGINGMKSRMAELGGRIRVRPLGNGTSVTAIVHNNAAG